MVYLVGFYHKQMIGAVCPDSLHHDGRKSFDVFILVIQFLVVAVESYELRKGQKVIATKSTTGLKKRVSPAHKFFHSKMCITFDVSFP